MSLDDQNRKQILFLYGGTETSSVDLESAMVSYLWQGRNTTFSISIPWPQKRKKSLHATELIIFFSPFLTEDLFSLVLDQIQIVNKDTAHGTQKIIEKLMSYHKVKPLKVLTNFVHFLKTVVLPKASILQRNLLIWQNMKHFIYICTYVKCK